MHRGALDVWDTLFALAEQLGITAEDGFSVDLEHLDAVTARMRGLKGYVADQLAALDSAANAAMLNWSGEAATVYQVAHREWADGATDIQDGLAAMESAAQIAHSNYSGIPTSCNRPRRTREILASARAQWKKPNLGLTQANFEWRTLPSTTKEWQGNGHLYITDAPWRLN